MNMGVILGAGSLAEIGLLIGSTIISSLITAVLGFQLGQWFYEFFTGEDITLSVREQFQKIKESFTDGSWKAALELWGEDIGKVFKALGNNIADWWNTYVVGPIEYALEDIRNGLSDLFGYDTAREKRSIGTKSHGNNGHLPKLATGAVIPPNAPFAAILGDQKHGTNIEAPLDTIKQAVREVMGAGGGGSYAFTAQINRRTLFEEMIDEAKLRQTTNGHNPFELT